MQINLTECRISRQQKPLENNFTHYSTRHLGDFIAIFRKKAALIMCAALLIIIVAGCGGEESFSFFSTSSETTGYPGGTNAIGDGARSAGSITGSVTLAWDAPVTNADGTPLIDLAGYKIYYGTSSGNYTLAIDVGNVTTYTVTNLSSGAYYFALVSYDTSRIESDYSNEASKIIQ